MEDIELHIWFEYNVHIYFFSSLVKVDVTFTDKTNIPRDRVIIFTLNISCCGVRPGARL